MAVTNDDISEAALKPKSATVGGNTVVSRDISELREAQDHAANETAAGRTHMGLRMVQLKTVRPS